MAIERGKSFILLEDLEKYAIWMCSELDDLMYPVKEVGDMPADPLDISIRSVFEIPAGEKFFGYIVGIKNLFSIAICISDKVFYFNLNLKEGYERKIKKIGNMIGKDLTMSDFSPLKYQTDIDLEGFSNIEGEFDLLKKRTNKERLDW